MLAAMSGELAAQSIPLEGIVVTSTKTSEPAIDALSGTSTLGKAELDQFQAAAPSTFLMTLPGVTTSTTARDTATGVNLRGLQDFGRVNVLIDGARQNFQKTGHNADGVFYIDPEMVKRVDITRGPAATIYGSGAIGGVAAFDLIDADDILKPGEYAALRQRGVYTTNGEGYLFSTTGALKAGSFDVLGQVNGRQMSDYEDGAGKVVPHSAETTGSSLAKARWRPAPGHQITGVILDYESQFVDSITSQGQPGQSPRDTDVHNQQYSLGYTFSRPDTPLFDFSAKVYRNNTQVDQRRLTGVCIPFPPACSLVNIPVGARRSFEVDTVGTDVFNTSRIDLGAFKLALTYGGDLFRDEVSNVDPLEGGDTFTPSGARTVYGSFLQSRLTFLDKLELIAALRYDSYNLSGTVITGMGTDQVETDGERVSPKVTLGYTPVKGITLFGTYAEGYRAPAVTETLISGFHPFPGPPFEFLPNPLLRPEVAHNVEAGVNFKFNNILRPSDAFRARAMVFRNKVDDFIDPTFVNPGAQFPSGAFQYTNISEATIEGVELEGMYDARSWFFGAAAHHIRGTNESTGEGLYSIPADRLVLTAGFRAWEERLIAGTRVHFVAAQDRIPSQFFGSALIEPSEAYTLVDLFAQYVINDHAVLSLNIDNVFDVDYRQYLDQNVSPGLNARIGLTLRFGATPVEAAAR
jgi:hemoglobin/transferrin/lactoferrin receptor protein